MNGQKGVVAGRRADGAAGVDMVGERHTVATRRHDRQPDLKGNCECDRVLTQTCAAACCSVPNQDFDLLIGDHVHAPLVHADQCSV